MFGAIGRGVTRRPWLVIAGWLLVATGIIATAPSIGSVINSNQSAFLPETSESARAAALAERAFGAQAGSTAVIVVQRQDSAPLTDTDVGRVGALAQVLNAQKPVAVAGVAFEPAQQVARNRTVALLAAQVTGAPKQAGVRFTARCLCCRVDHLSPPSPKTDTPGIFRTLLGGGQTA